MYVQFNRTVTTEQDNFNYSISNCNHVVCCVSKRTFLGCIKWNQKTLFSIKLFIFSVKKYSEKENNV